MAAALVAGIGFSKEDSIWVVDMLPRESPGSSAGPTHGAWKVLNDIAVWLGYADFDAYNAACEERPAEVRRRLKAAV